MFADVVRYINNWPRGKSGCSLNNLELTRLFIDRLNMQDKLNRLRFVHVAGTKGKGTTAAYTSALLQAYGFKVGLFVSPHIVDVRERMMVNNAFLPKEDFARHFFSMLDRFMGLANSESQISRDLAQCQSYFCFLFLLALDIFAAESVEVAVLEVGMGGRLDSTNVVSPEVTVITSLGLDHMSILGHTVEEVAAEKAGIIKPRVICYTTPQEWHPSTLKVLKTTARARQAPLVVVNAATLPISSWPPLAIGGAHAVENSKLALLAARFVAGKPPTIPLDGVERHVLQTMTFTGRSQVVPVGGGAVVTLYFDGAHTFESLTCATRWFLEQSRAVTGDANPRRVLLFYTSREPAHILKAFMPFIHFFSKVIMAFVVNPRTARGPTTEERHDHARGELTATMECWKEMYPEIPCLPCNAPFASLQELISMAGPAATDNEDASKPVQIFATGSFFLLSDLINLVKKHQSQF
ncbi:putative folylpolyglutamate synthase [Trypanosoma rangeli]|uniref:tetrahydrofolate synthase n=1 Tax=Trypanosoma rangeli TaxID=5698 RepID=A0A3R7RIQ8_TRYRA|nr:putative folylpolyglutamate synthase [Trypanosoma rangeli]RNF03377.1 putative folylpolyglutamate synthase [Trypanosoma rangeli]|eukprot:RNF03377.1 putative folylpolyglutamate synthase [Trypanosoma rangeli]